MKKTIKQFVAKHSELCGNAFIVAAAAIAMIAAFLVVEMPINFLIDGHLDEESHATIFVGLLFPTVYVAYQIMRLEMRLTIKVIKRIRKRKGA